MTKKNTAVETPETSASETIAVRKLAKLAKLASMRVPRALRAIALVGALGKYKPYDDQVVKIIGALTEAVDQAEQNLRPKQTAKDSLPTFSL
jgi:hypothetical protein